MQQHADAVTITTTRTRSPEQIIAEGRQIYAQFRAAGRTVRPPHAVARVLDLWDESGLTGKDFAKATGFDQACLYFWRKGKTSSGTAWPALVGVLAERKGRAMAALVNEQIVVAVPAQRAEAPQTVTTPTPEARPQRQRAKTGRPVGRPPKHAPAAPVLARRVTMWADTANGHHATREAAEEASLRVAAERAAEALAEAMAPASAAEALLANPDLVIQLADAVRAARAGRRTH